MLPQEYNYHRLYNNHRLRYRVPSFAPSKPFVCSWVFWSQRGWLSCWSHASFEILSGPFCPCGYHPGTWFVSREPLNDLIDLERTMSGARSSQIGHAAACGSSTFRESDTAELTTDFSDRSTPSSAYGFLGSSNHHIGILTDLLLLSQSFYQKTFVLWGNGKYLMLHTILSLLNLIQYYSPGRKCWRYFFCSMGPVMSSRQSVVGGGWGLGLGFPFFFSFYFRTLLSFQAVNGLRCPIALIFSKFL